MKPVVSTTNVSPSRPQGVLNDVVIIPFNNPHASREIIEKYANQIAAILIDPFGQKYGRKIPTDEFLITLKNLSAENNILLIVEMDVRHRSCSRDSIFIDDT